jgi:general secretion pathway protein B
MSYILEAIKKADHKRKLGEVPDVHSDHDLDLEEPAKRVVWPYLLAALLFFNAAVIAWWLEPWNDKPQVAVKDKIETPKAKGTSAVDPTSTTTETADSKGNIVPPVAVPEIITNPSSNIGGDSPNQTAALTKQEDAPATITIQPVNKEADLDAAIPTVVPPPPISPVLKNTSTIESAPPEISIDMTSADKLVSENKPASQLNNVGESQTGSIAPLQGIKEVGEIAQSSETTDANATTLEKTVLLEEDGEEVDPDEEDEEIEVEEIKAFDISKIPLQYQLPMSIQQKLPEIKMSFHSYKYRPGSRLVRINGRIMREGQDMTKEVKLEKIVPSGVVMLFEGRRFRVKL